jgi:hypothetical protein
MQPSQLHHFASSQLGQNMRLNPEKSLSSHIRPYSGFDG